MPGFRLIVGLGNPGPEYADTRHNAGAWLVEQWVDQLRLSWSTESRMHGRIARTGDVRFLLPDTYMNRSGLSVLSVANYFKILPADILVAHDELDLAVGLVRLKIGGGHGGHNGLRDIIQVLGHPGFGRLRIGIGRPPSASNKNVVDFVLHAPGQAERTLIDQSIGNALNHRQLLLDGNTASFMNLVHSLTAQGN